MIDIFLRNIDKAAEVRDLTKLEQLIHQLLSILIIPRVEIVPGTEVQRIRNNYHGETFFSEKEISFRTDIWNIKDFGRCNLPNSSKFYSTLSSKYIKEIRVANVLETNRIFRDNLSIRKRQVFTSGKWVIREPLVVAIFPFNKYAKGSNSEISFHANKYEEIINSFDSEQKQIAKKVLPFISYHLSKKHIKSHWDYAISAFFSEFILDKYNLDGILYPSVRTNYKTYNLMLEPISVNKLQFTQAAMFELLIDRKKVFIDNMADGEVTVYNKILWTQIERSSEKELSWRLK